MGGVPNKLVGIAGVGEGEVPFRLNELRLNPVPAGVAGVAGVGGAPPNVPKGEGVGGVTGGVVLAKGFIELNAFGVEGGAEGRAGDGEA